jgi:hypothetical protein
VSAISEDGLDWAAEPGILIDDLGMSVPDAVLTPEGGVRVFWVEFPDGFRPEAGVPPGPADGPGQPGEPGQPPEPPEPGEPGQPLEPLDPGEGGEPPAPAGAVEEEVLVSAYAADGRSFEREDGFRLEGGYVDPVVIRAEPGDWLMLASTTPTRRNDAQKIFLCGSEDGLDWWVEPEPIISDPARQLFDPAAVRLPDGTYRVYLASGVFGGPPADDHTLITGILRPPD